MGKLKEILVKSITKNCLYSIATRTLPLALVCFENEADSLEYKFSRCRDTKLSAWSYTKQLSFQCIWSRISWPSNFSYKKHKGRHPLFVSPFVIFLTRPSSFAPIQGYDFLSPNGNEMSENEISLRKLNEK